MPDLADLRETLRSLRRVTGMWLPSNHYAAVVSFITGLDKGSGGWLLDGFGNWLGAPSVVWWGQIEFIAVGRQESPHHGDMYRRLTDDDSKRCLELLFVKLDEFLDERDPSLAVPPSAD